MKSVTYILFLGFLAIISSSSAINARSGSVAVSFSDHIYVFGGKTEQPACTCSYDNFETTSEVQVYSTVSEDFVDVTNMLNERAFHSAVELNGKIYIFGGHATNTTLEVFDIEAQAWSIAEVQDDGLSWTPLGKTPSARFGHASAAVEGKIFIFGGIDYESGNALNDLWYYSVSGEEWVELSVAFTPSPRAGAAVFPVLNGFAIFGGFDTHVTPRYLNTLWQFNADTNQWTHLTPEDSPSPRAFASGIVVDGKFYLFGGESPNPLLHGDVLYYSDVWVYSAGEWSEFEYLENARPAARSAAAAAYNSASEYAFVFFGRDQEQSFADAWDLWLPTGAFTQGSCLPGHHFPTCKLDCSSSNWCNGHGTCIAENVCCCDAGWTGEGISTACSENPCEGYRGFTTDALNQILLPKSFESTFNKLDIISHKLKNVRELLPSIEAHHVDMTNITKEAYNFFQSCLVQTLCETTECFENLVGCDANCGDETFCVVGDVCHNGQCINGTARDCSGDFKDNKCVNSWCDDTYGCMHSAVQCDDGLACTVDTCDPEVGCVSTKLTCDDGDCCTDDSCVDGECLFIERCEDWNPCTIDKCENSCFQNAECHYDWDSDCLPNAGANKWEVCEDTAEDFHWTTHESRPLGNPIEFLGANMVPAQPEPNSNYDSTGYFWLRSEACELIYSITVDGGEADHEDGAHIYGPASAGENAGVVHTLKSGSWKNGIWNFCKDGVDAKDIKNGKYYVVIYSKFGDSRAQLEFETEDVGGDCSL